MSGAVLVTGASGFLGLNLVEWLLASDRQVVAAAWDPFPASALAEMDRSRGRLSTAEVDVRSPRSVTALFGAVPITAVIHAAAATPGPAATPAARKAAAEINVEGTRNLLAACADRPVRRVVFVSSGAVYGEAAFGNVEIDETTDPAPATVYGVSKLDGEHLVAEHGRAGHAVVVARVSALFGPWERDTGFRDLASPFFQLARAAMEEAAVHLPSTAPRNWLYARDAAYGVGHLATAPTLSHELYNVGGAVPFGIEGFVQRLQRVWPSAVDGGRPVRAAHPVFDADPGRHRAPISVERLRAEIGTWPRFDPDAAFDDYIAWLRTHREWMEQAGGWGRAAPGPRGS